MSQYHMSVAYRKLERLPDAMECCEVLFVVAVCGGSSLPPRQKSHTDSASSLSCPSLISVLQSWTDTVDVVDEQVQAAVVVLFQALDLHQNMLSQALFGSVNEGWRGWGGVGLVFTAVLL